MDKDSNNSDIENTSFVSDTNTDKSFVGKFKSHVTGIINNTPLSKWFRKQQELGDDKSPTVRVRDEDFEDDELYQMQPPTKRAKLPVPVEEEVVNSYSNNISEATTSKTISVVAAASSTTNRHPDSFLEPVAGPSGIKPRKLIIRSASASGRHPHAFSSSGLVNGHKDSDSEESTSGYSSVARIGSKEQVCESQENSKQPSPVENSLRSNTRSLFHTNSSISQTFSSLSPNNMNSSLSSRRPSFNASTFGSPNFLDKTLSTKRIINSPFYNGRTIYGGASAYGRQLNRPIVVATRSPVQIKPVNSSSSSTAGGLTLGKTARRILDTLEQYSSPVNDAKKIPMMSSRKHNSEGFLTRYVVGASPYMAREVKQVASNKELMVPSVSDLLKMKQRERLQESTETVRRIAAKSKSALNSESAASYKIAETEMEKPKHTNKFRTKITGTKRHNQTEFAEVPEVKLKSIPLPITVLPKFDLKIPPTAAAAAVKPLIEPAKPPTTVTTTTKPDEQFKFSKPLIIAENHRNIVALNNFKFSEPLNKKRHLEKSEKNNGETTTTTTELKPASKKVSLMDKFKPAEGTWECSVCMIRNQAEKTKCAACETPKSPPKDPKLDLWECPKCRVRNNPKSANCNACATMRDKPKSGPFFGDKFNATPLPPAPSLGVLFKSSGVNSFGDKFKPPPTTWECSVCMIRNNDSLSSCAACNTAKPGGAAPTAVPSEQQWECSVCMVRNKPTVLSCVCCEAAKPGTSGGSGVNKDKAKEKSISTFSFGIDNASATKFSFGVPQQLPATLVESTGAASVFGEAAVKTAPATTGGFTFGVPAKPAAVPLVESKPIKPADEPVKPVETPKVVPEKSVELKPTQIIAEKSKSSSTTTTTVTTTPPMFNFTPAPSVNGGLNKQLFGAKPSETPTTTTTSLFKFSSPATAPDTVNNGFTTTAPVKFEFNEPRPAKTPGFNFNPSSTTTTATTVPPPVSEASGGFNFNFDKNASNKFGESGGMAMSLFGTATTAKNGTTGGGVAPAVTFNFGGAQQPNNNNNSQKAGFSFGAVKSPSFNFGSGGANNITTTPAPPTGGFNFGGAPPSFDATTKPTFNFTDGNVTPFSASSLTDGSAGTPQRKIKRAIRRTQR